MPELRDDHQTFQGVKRIFVTGISTDVGKTVASAIITEALQADYWKPIQAGDLHNTDSHRIENLISNHHSKIHPSAYTLKTPMSPHAAADIDGLRISLDRIKEPETQNHLVIEGAGGLLVPLNEQDTILDLIKDHYKVVLVSRHYLGSINHTLLSADKLISKGLEVFLLFSGNEHPTTEEIIVKKTGIRIIGRIVEEKEFNKDIVKAYAVQFSRVLNSI